MNEARAQPVWQPHATHQFEPHTGEVRLSLWAPTRGALLVEAGRALAELMLGEDAAPGRRGPAVELDVRARDGAALLAEWLNELISRSEISKRVFTDFELDAVEEAHVRGRAWGVGPAVIKTAPKAATLHGLTLSPLGAGFRGTVVLDV